jgi:hypothetical protein
MIKMVEFTVEDGPIRKIFCKTCRGPIVKSDIRVSLYKFHNSSLFFHLDCFTPFPKQYIRKSDLKLNLKSHHELVFENWLQNWNSNFTPLELVSVNPIFIHKGVQGPGSKYKRTYLEIFKFLDATEVAFQFSTVNKEFYSVSWDNELWIFFLHRDFMIHTFAKDARMKYIEEFNQRCWECKQVHPNEEFFRCPILKKILCKSCLKTFKYERILKNDIEGMCGVRSNKLNINFGTLASNDVFCYRVQLQNSLQEFRQNNVNNIVNKILGEFEGESNLVKIIKTINIERMDNKSDFRKQPNDDLQYNQKTLKYVYEFIRTGKLGITWKKLFRRIRIESEVKNQ